MKTGFKRFGFYRPARAILDPVVPTRAAA